MTLEPHVRAGFHFDDGDDAPVLELVVDGYDALFNPLDRAPHHRRDLSPDLKAYLSACSTWIEPEVPITLDVLLRDGVHDEVVADAVRAGFRHYYEYQAHVVRGQLRRRRRRVLTFGTVSFLFLAAALWMRQRVDNEAVLPAFMVTGLTVGGWIFMWEAVALALIRPLDLVQELAGLARLSTARLRFR